MRESGPAKRYRVQRRELVAPSCYTNLEKPYRQLAEIRITRHVARLPRAGAFCYSRPVKFLSREQTESPGGESAKHTPHVPACRVSIGCNPLCDAQNPIKDDPCQNQNQLFEQARQTIPGGVNSPVRAFNGVGGTPRFIDHADGAYLYDVDGQAYVDYIGSWGPMLLGHNHPAIKAAVIKAVEKGLSYGAPTEIEVLMAEKVRQIVPSMEQVRMVNSGTEATMSAIRLARGYTGRDKIVKFEGCYHGHADSLLVKAGSGALTLGQPNSPGVPADFAKHTLTCVFNDLDSVREAFTQYGSEIACIIVEPVAGNMNCIPPVPGFLEGLRAICDEFGALLILDEVMTGFRVSLRGAQGYYNIDQISPPSARSSVPACRSVPSAARRR